MKDTDGRRFRRERTHKALIDACIVCMRQARVPEVTEVAAMAGVSTRTVFLHFEVIANLHSEALRAILQTNGAPRASNDTRGTLAQHPPV